MDGLRVVLGGAHPCGREVLLQGGARLALQDVEVHGVQDAGLRGGRRDLFACQGLGVARGGRAAPRVVRRQVGQLHAQDGGLDLVQPRVRARQAADVAILPAVFAQPPDLLGDLGRGRRDAAAVADGAQVLGRVEAEGGRIAEGADLAPVKLRAVGLRAVLDHLEAVTPGELHDPGHVGRVAVDVDRDDGLGRGRDEAFEGAGVHAAGGGVDVAEDRHGARELDGRRGGDRRVGDGDDLVAGLDAHGAQGEGDGVRAVGDPHAVRKAEEGGEFTLEGLDLLAEDVPALLQDPRDGGLDGLRVRVVLGLGVRDGDRGLRHDRAPSSATRWRGSIPRSVSGRLRARCGASSRVSSESAGSRRSSRRCRWPFARGGRG
ncbi:hypothetical protein D3C86_1234510 [compost metagenome]